MPSDGDLNRCRVCGVLETIPPWGEDGRNPTFDFCPCCGVEFGYGDNNPGAARKWRERWIAAGAVWDEPSERPADWSLEEQLSHVPAAFR
jgi:hypothetical protein